MINQQQKTFRKPLEAEMMVDPNERWDKYHIINALTKCLNRPLNAKEKSACQTVADGNESSIDWTTLGSELVEATLSLNAEKEASVLGYNLSSYSIAEIRVILSSHGITHIRRVDQPEACAVEQFLAWLS